MFYLMCVQCVIDKTWYVYSISYALFSVCARARLWTVTFSICMVWMSVECILFSTHQCIALLQRLYVM